MCVDLRSDHGVNHMLIHALKSSNLRLALGNWQKASNSFILLEAPFIQKALAITAMTSPSLCFLPSVTMCQHCLHSVIAQLVSWVCGPLFLFLHVSHAFLHFPHAFLFKMQLTGFSDWWAAWMCLLYMLPH